MQLALGTVQLGMPYGIANAQGMPDEQTAVDILRAACECGMRWIDTAAAYGVSEATLGSALPRAWSGDAPRIATKFVLDEALAPAAQLDAALEKLRRDRIEALLLHRETDIDHPCFAEFAALAQNGRVESVGVSIYAPQIALRGLEAGLQCLQVPLNLFDTASIDAGVLKKAAETGARVFVRSIFLQGLFFLKPDHPRAQAIPGASAALAALEAFCQKHAVEPQTLALAFGALLGEDAVIVLVAENASQVRSNAALAIEAEKHRELAARWLRERPAIPPNVTNPGTWPRVAA